MNRLCLEFSSKPMAENFEVWNSLDTQFVAAKHRSEVLPQVPFL
jgi:hypothetical protein